MSLLGIPQGQVVQIDCGDCHACCKRQIVVLFPGDDTTRGDWKLEGPAMVVRQKPNGDCIHLGTSGCDVYETRPIMCRAFDCERAASHPLLSRLPGASNDAVQREGWRRMLEHRAEGTEPPPVIVCRCGKCGRRLRDGGQLRLPF